MANITIRRALEDDRSAVINGIGPQFGGFDYLNAYYYDFVTNPDFLSFVAMDGDKVVGFYSAHVIDGGQTICKRGGRVKESHQNQGIFTQLSTYIDKQVSIHWPNVKWETFVTLADNANRVSNGFVQKKGFKEILRMDGPLMTIDVTALPLVKARDVHHLWELSQGDMDFLFSDSETCDRIFTQNRFLSFLVPLRCMKKNIQTFFNGKSFIVASKSLQKRNQEYLCDNDIQLKNNFDINNNELITLRGLSTVNQGKLNACIDYVSNKQQVIKSGTLHKTSVESQDISLISLVTQYTCVPGLRYHVDILGSDFTDLESHLMFHLHRLQSLGHSKVHLSFEAIPEALDMVKSACDIVFGQYGNTRKRFYFERDFKQV